MGASSRIFRHVRSVPLDVMVYIPTNLVHSRLRLLLLAESPLEDSRPSLRSAEDSAHL